MNQQKQFQSEVTTAGATDNIETLIEEFGNLKSATTESNSTVLPLSLGIPPARIDFPFDGIVDRSQCLMRYARRYLPPSSDLGLGDARSLLQLGNVQRIATYNWLELSYTGHLPCNTMIVPGAPRMCISNDRLNRQIPLKIDKYFLSDPNAYYHPQYPFEPIVRAIDLCHEGSTNTFNYQDYDIMCDSNCLQLLYRYIANTIEKNKHPVRFDIQRFGRLVVLARSEAVPILELKDTRGYGIDFKRRMTESHSELTEGPFQQVVTYAFGQLRCIVVSKVDCADGTISKGDSALNSTATTSEVFSQPKAERFDNSQLHYIKYGALRLFQMIELATRKVGKSIHWDSIWPRVFFCGAIFMLIGYVHYKSGRISNVENMSRLDASIIKQRNSSNSLEALQQTHYMLRKIVDFCRSKDDGLPLAIIFDRDEPVKLFKRDQTAYPQIVPETLMRRMQSSNE